MAGISKALKWNLIEQFIQIISASCLSILSTGRNWSSNWSLAVHLLQDPKDKRTLLFRKLEQAGSDPTSLAADGSNRPSSSQPGSASSRKRRRVT